MAIDIEVNLKVPSLTAKPPDAPVQKINNSSRRFSKRIPVEAMPKLGDRLELTAASAEPFECTVVRTDWSDDKNLFVVSCSFARRSIALETYNALLADSAWTVTDLP